MPNMSENLERLEVIVVGLKEMAKDAIFIGGACTQFYVENPDLTDIRPTKDVDCIVQISTPVEFARFSEKLRLLGFSNDMSENAPMVRWKFKGVIVDTIPDNCAIMGYRDIPWFREGRKHALEKTLPSGLAINILPLAYFLATKLEASKDRGQGDYWNDHDIEDIITVIDGNDNIEEILAAPDLVKGFISESFRTLLRDDNFRRSISGHLGFDTSASERAKFIEEKMKAVI